MDAPVLDRIRALYDRWWTATPAGSPEDRALTEELVRAVPVLIGAVLMAEDAKRGASLRADADDRARQLAESERDAAQPPAARYREALRDIRFLCAHYWAGPADERDARVKRIWELAEAALGSVYPESAEDGTSDSEKA